MHSFLRSNQLLSAYSLSLLSFSSYVIGREEFHGYVQGADAFHLFHPCSRWRMFRMSPSLMGNAFFHGMTALSLL